MSNIRIPVFIAHEADRRKRMTRLVRLVGAVAAVALLCVKQFLLV